MNYIETLCSPCSIALVGASVNPRVAIVTFAAGCGIITLELIEEMTHLELASLSADIVEALRGENSRQASLSRAIRAMDVLAERSRFLKQLS